MFEIDLRKLLLVLAITLFPFTTMPAASALAKDLKIKTATKYYNIRGKTTVDLARAMATKGPYSPQQRVRAWATTDRRVSWKILSKRHGKNCRVIRAIVRLNLTYTMPRLRNVRKTNPRLKRKWARMLALLTRHERQHGKYFTRFSRDVQKGLLKLKPRRNCRSLVTAGQRLVKRLSKKDLARNDRFEIRDKPNYRRMTRIIQKG